MSMSTGMISRRSSGWHQSPWRVILGLRRLNCAGSRDSSRNTSRSYWRRGMSISDVRPGERVKDVRFTEDVLVVDLLDGRTISVPLAWYPRLLAASHQQRSNWRVAGSGFGIHWPDIDEDLSTEGLLRGAPAPRPRQDEDAANNTSRRTKRRR